MVFRCERPDVGTSRLVAIKVVGVVDPEPAYGTIPYLRCVDTAHRGGSTNFGDNCEDDLYLTGAMRKPLDKPRYSRTGPFVVKERHVDGEDDEIGWAPVFVGHHCSGRTTERGRFYYETLCARSQNRQTRKNGLAILNVQ